MIDPKELRIGNFVNEIGLDNETRYSVRIDMPTLNVIAENEEMFEPVTLTPEILKEYGFREFGEWFLKTIPLSASVDISISLIHNKTTIGGMGYRDDEYEVNHVKYLHQLQNLYHAINGEELEINL